MHLTVLAPASLQIAKKIKEISALKAIPEKSRDHFQKVKIESEPALQAELEELEKAVKAAGGSI